VHDGEHFVLAMGQVVAAIKSRMNLNETWSPHIVWLQKPLKAWSVRDCHAASGSGKRAESGVSSAISELAQMPQAGSLACAHRFASCIFNHLHPLGLFLTHRHHPAGCQILFAVTGDNILKRYIALSQV
jgi:hypothetical protein